MPGQAYACHHIAAMRLATANGPYHRGRGGKHVRLRSMAFAGARVDADGRRACSSDRPDALTRRPVRGSADHRRHHDAEWLVAATNDLVGVAIAAAIADCQMRFRHARGCGAVQTTVRAGWSLGMRCGDRHILVAAKTLAEAEQAAIDREVELRRAYGADLPPCVRVMSVDPSGIIVAPYAAELVGMVMGGDDRSLR